MAGDIKRQRKSWTLQDRSKVSINILRANLAEDGDEEAQLDVAKRLLQEGSAAAAPEKTQNENARLALYWLIKSSEQGNDEATQLLKECLQSGRGLTAQNVLDVRTCVTTPKDEKLTFKSARVLHRKLSNGEEFITTAQLLARVKAKRKSVTFEQGNGIGHGELFPDEDHGEEQQHEGENVRDSDAATDAVSTPSPAEDEDAKKKINLNETFVVPSSHIQPVSSSSSSSSKSLNVESSNSRLFENSFSKAQSQISGEKQAALEYAMTQPGKKLTLSDLLKAAKDFNLGRIPEISVEAKTKLLGRHNWDSSSFPNVFLLQLLVLAVVGNVMQLGDAVRYLLLLSLVWSSYNLFLWKLRYENFKDWRNAFGSVFKEGVWNAEKMEMRFSGRYLLPYLIVISLSYLLMTVVTPQDSFSTVAVALLVLGAIHFGALHQVVPSWQQILMISAALIYYQCPIVTSVLGESITRQTEFLHQPMISADAKYFQYLPFPVTVYSFFNFVLLLTTLKTSVLGLLRTTFPEMVFTLWLLRVVKACVLVEHGEFLSAAFTALTICVVMGLLGSKLKTWKIAVVICTTAIMLTITFGLSLNEYHGDIASEGQLHDKSIEFLDWSEYDSTCHRKAWNVLSPAATQIKCSTLYGNDKQPMVKWKGRISIVKVEKISRSFFKDTSFDDVVFDISVGILPFHADDGSRNWQSFLPGSSDAETVSPASLIVATSELRDKKRKQYLVDHVLNFRTGDKIEFIGKLKGSTAGSLKPRIYQVQSLQCISCATADYGEFILDRKGKHHGFEWLQNLLDESVLPTLFNNLKSLMRDLVVA